MCIRDSTALADWPDRADAWFLDGFSPAKRLRWHIDYLLDETAVEIVHVTLLRAAVRLESAVAGRLADAPGAVAVRPGLGASDTPGETHLWRLRGEPVDALPYLTDCFHDIMS